MTDSSMIDKELFETACRKMTGLEKGLHGIGTLSEKTVHSVLKYYYAPDETYHEIKIGNYVADICVDGEIFEIQTRAFNHMRKKLESFLPEHDVTIIYPVAHTKWISWIDMESGELSPKRKSPKTGNFYRIIPELYKISMFMNDPHLHFIITLIDVEEHRYLNGWSYNKKRGSSRADGFPTDIFAEMRIDKIEDFLQFLPDSLPDEFTSKDLKASAHIPIGYAQTLLLLLFDMNLVKRIGKTGNSYIYSKI